ncbi:MAG: pyridoxal phosphate-dependent aminotransferase [Acidiferrobacter sp.]
MSTVERFIADAVRTRTAYAVPSGTPRIKLDAMENPYRLPVEVRDRIAHALRDVDMNHYPAADSYEQLKVRLGAAAAVPAGCGIILGNGSDELLQMLMLAMAPDVTVIAPVPTFVMYEQLAALTGHKFVGVPLGGDFVLDLPAVQRVIAAHTPALVFLSYPNNPTGALYPRAAIEELLACPGAVIVIDEAYYPFAEATFVGDLADHTDLLVIRTLSKQGLAGIRMGWLAAAHTWTHELDKLRLPYNVNSLTCAVTQLVLDYTDILNDQARRVRDERERLYAALTPHVTVWPSAANFLLFRPHRAADAGRIHAALKARGIWIKNLDGHDAALRGCLRVTVGTPEDNVAFLAALRAAL